MSILRRPVRNTKTVGSKVYAVVEEIHKGRATVRLQSNGQRLTNLPTLSPNILPADIVVVNVAANGKPYIHSLEKPYVPPVQALATTSPPEKVEEPTTFAARLTYSGSDSTETDYYGGGGWPNSVPYYFLFDTAVYDTAGMFDTENGNIIITRDGRYLMHYCIRISCPTPPASGSIKAMIYYEYVGSSFKWQAAASQYWDWRCHDGGSMMIGATQIFTLYRGEHIGLYMDVEAGGNDMYGHHPHYPYTVIQEEGRSPILECFRITDISSAIEAQRDFFDEYY